jgi:hypothetical protein
VGLRPNTYQRPTPVPITCRTEVEEAADQSGIEMAAPQVDLVSIDKLPNHINRKVWLGFRF